MKTAACLISALSTNGAFPRAARHSRGAHASRAYLRGSALPIAYRISNSVDPIGHLHNAAFASAYIDRGRTLRVVTPRLLGIVMITLVLPLIKCGDISQLKMAALRVIFMKVNTFAETCQLGKLSHYVRAVATLSLENSVIPTPERVHTTPARLLSFEL